MKRNSFFGTLWPHIAKVDYSRRIKKVVMGQMDGDDRRRRHYQEWLDDIKEWCQRDIA